MTHAPAPKTVALFATCLMDALRPSVGRAAIQLLEGAGFRVAVPADQTCCGQPGWNAGADDDARALAARVIAAFEGFDYVVAPSGSCAGMIQKHYPEAFKDDAAMRARAEALAVKTHELTSFLVNVAGVAARDMAARTATEKRRTYYHDSCAGLRELGVKAEPRALLAGVEDVELCEGAECETCCGFGGLFCIKYDDISTAIADHKIDDILKTGADMVLGGDLGCLVHLQGRLSRLGHDIEVRHVAEILAGLDATVPAIGEDEKTRATRRDEKRRATRRDRKTKRD